jgi:predicted MPP superfamily phosphohydrolase
MITRRGLFKWLGTLAATGLATASYAFAIEPGFRLNTTVYSFTPPNWTPGLRLRIVMLADLHCVEPHMPLSRWKRIIAAANELQPDMHLLMGDYVAGHFWRTGTVKTADIAKAATALKSPVGTFAITGNHDWWDDLTVQKTKQGLPLATRELEANGIPVLENDARRLEKDGLPFWLTGTSSMVAMKTKREGVFEGRDDLSATLAKVSDNAPIIHLAHEPDLFVDVPERVSLTLSGHTHGGQVRLFGKSLVVPSGFGDRFAYGHIVEDGRHLVVSGGLGCSIFPVRFGMPPEIVVLELGWFNQ